MTRGNRLFAAAARWSVEFAPLASVPLAFALSGCAHKIGDSCTQSTDCSVSGTLVCDTTQPDGYCTQLNCTGNSCQNGALCVLFQSTIPGCGYDDYHSPSRTGRSFCVAYCTQDSDCRQSEGYVCRDPSQAPWNGEELDDLQNRRGCIVDLGLLSKTKAYPDAAVCSYVPEDAGSSEEGDAAGDAGGIDGGIDSGGAADAGVDAAGVADAGDGGRDGDVDAPGDAAVEGTVDATVDAGAADAAGGG